MSDEIKPIGLLCMWLLVTRGGDALLRDIRPECKAEYRRPLVARGLIEEAQEGRTKRLSLTDAGWHYVATHMDAPVKSMSAGMLSNVLQGVLAMLLRHMTEKEYSFAEMFAPASASAIPAGETPDGRKASASGDGLWGRLSRSWSQWQQADEGISLETLRSAFSEVSRDDLDNALREWQRQGRIVIYPYDDGERITPEVKAAALSVNGRDLHTIYRK